MYNFQGATRSGFEFFGFSAVLMIIRFSDPEVEPQGLTVRFLRDGKIMVKFGQKEHIHYTLHPGTTSGMVDLHKTNETLAKTDPHRYETVVRIPKAAIEEELEHMSPSFLIEMLRLWRPLRLGWMIRRQLVIGPRFPGEDDLQGLKGFSIKAGPAACAEPLASWMKPPEFYEEILECPNVGYSLFDGRKKSRQSYGVAIAYRSTYGNVKLTWARTRDLNRWAKKWEPILLEKWALLGSDSNVCGPHS
jgi:hypothetical protein